MHRCHASNVMWRRTVTIALAKLLSSSLCFLKIYTADKNFTRPPVAPVAPNINSVYMYFMVFEDQHPEIAIVYVIFHLCIVLYFCIFQILYFIKNRNWTLRVSSYFYHVFFVLLYFLDSVYLQKQTLKLDIEGSAAGNGEATGNSSRIFNVHFCISQILYFFKSRR